MSRISIDDSDASTHEVIDPAALTRDRVYKLLIGSVVPRPIAWVSSADSEGVANLAPFSAFTFVSTEPPMIAVAIGNFSLAEEGARKDTITNIRARREFVVNIASVQLGDALAMSARAMESHVDEFAVVGLTHGSCEVVSVPRVAEAPISMECTLESIIEPGSDEVVIGRIVRYHIRRDLVLERGRIDVEALDPLGRLAGAYSTIGDTYELPRVGPKVVGNPAED
jgi:flavin reductase (DIM6/NTAB) family NADH-FMN oxidoreductase RutF